MAAAQAGTLTGMGVEAVAGDIFASPGSSSFARCRGGRTLFMATSVSRGGGRLRGDGRRLAAGGVGARLADPGPRRENVRQTDPAKEFRANTVGDGVDDLAAVLRRINVRAERTFAERQADDADDGVGDDR